MSGSRRAIVFGAAGQLGATIVAHLGSDARTRFDVTGLTRREVDVTDSHALDRLVDDLAPALVVNCTAYNDVDGAEEDPSSAIAVNSLAVRRMARAAARHDSIFVHYSTDFVFDGQASEPYTEDDRPLPLSVYGASKLLGEWFAASAPRHYVLRVESLFGGSQGRSSIDRMLDALETGQQARAFQDRIASPSYTEDVAAATETLVARGAPPGIYHCVNSGFASWFDIGRWLALQTGADEGLVRPVLVREVQMRAARPAYCAMSNAKLAGAGHRMPEWRDAVRRYLERRPFRRVANREDGHAR